MKVEILNGSNQYEFVVNVKGLIQDLDSAIVCAERMPQDVVLKELRVSEFEYWALRLYIWKNQFAAGILVSELEVMGLPNMLYQKVFHRGYEIKKDLEADDFEV